MMEGVQFCEFHLIKEDFFYFYNDLFFLYNLYSYFKEKWYGIFEDFNLRINMLYLRVFDEEIKEGFIDFKDYKL